MIKKLISHKMNFSILVFFLLFISNLSIAQNCDPKWDRTTSKNCVNSPIQFYSNASGLNSYEWEWGDGIKTGIGTTPAYRDPIHAFSSSGLYTITFKGTGPGGKTCSDTLMLYIHENPKVNFTSNFPDSCVYGTVILKNLTDTNKTKLKDIAKFVWNFGDTGSTGNVVIGDYKNNSNLYLSIKKRYDVSGKTSDIYKFNSKLTIITKNGCSDSFTLYNSATVALLNVKIKSENKNSCVSDISNFKIVDIKTGDITALSKKYYISSQWNFGDPQSGSLNIISKNINEILSHQYSIGSWMTSVKIELGKCNATFFDTIIKSGPLSKIEIPNNRIPEDQKYQSIIRDTVRFTNNSVFYHNDPNPMYEDSIKNGKYVFKYPGDQTAIPSKLSPKKERRKDNVLRIWDFGDNYAPKCTTDTKKNKNVGLNCNFSMDTLPVHWYTPWNDIYSFYNNSEYYTSPADKIVLCKGNKTNYKVKYYRQATLLIPADTLVIVPNDSSFNYAGRTITSSTKENFSGLFKIKKVQSKIKGPAIYTPTLSAETWTFYTNSSVFIKNIITGNKYTKSAGIVTLNKGDQFELKKGDSAIIRPQAFITSGKSITAQPSTLYIDTIIGNRDTFVQTSRVFVDSNLHKNNFYLKNAQSYIVSLIHQDTVNSLKCKSLNTEILALVKPSAEGLTYNGIKCYAPPSPPFGMEFDLSMTKPGLSQRLLKVNFDSAGGKNNWVTHSGLLSPPLPGTTPWDLGYQNTGTYPNKFVNSYAAGSITNKNPGWVTIGLIIGNGKLIGSLPEILDTVWYHNAFRYLHIDSRFTVIQPEADMKRVCVGDTISFLLTDPKMDSITQLVWNWNDAEGTYYEERFYYYQPYKGPNAKRNDKNIKWKSTDKWLYNYVIRINFDGVKDNIIDTIVTGIIRKWSIGVDVSKSNSIIFKAFQSIGLNLRDISPTDIPNYFGNGKTGTIDTTGFGNSIKFGICPYRDALSFKKANTWFRYTDYKKKDSIIISQKLHFRDSSMVGFDTLKQKNANRYTNLKVSPGVYRHVYKKTSRYYPSLTLRNTEGCMSPRNKEVNVGFFSDFSLSDTVICSSGEVVLKDSIRYFAYNDPMIWLNPNNYWDNYSRYYKYLETKSVDFNQYDDTLSNKRFEVKGIGPFKYTYNKPGKYVIRIAMKDSLGCIDTIAKSINITNGPLVKISVNRDSVFCKGDSAILSASGAKSYLWSNSSTNSSITVYNSGKYTVTGTVSGGCKSSKSINISSSNGPLVKISANRDSVFCKGDSAILSASGAKSYLWNNSSTNNSITVYNSGKYTVTGTDNIGCKTNKSINITTNQIPAKPTITKIGKDTLQSSYNTNNQWYKNGNIINGATGKIYKVLSYGIYSVKYVDSKGCSNMSDTIGIRSGLKVIDILNKNNIHIYPNPANDIIYFEFDKSYLGKIELIDVFGKIIIETELINENNTQMQVANLNYGVYYLRIGNLVFKLMKI